MSRHTKGPWTLKIGRWSGQPNAPYIMKDGINLGKGLQSPKIHPAEVHANAALMACAPELLDTCKWTLACLKNLGCSDDVTSAKRELEAVIAKAEGDYEKVSPV